LIDISAAFIALRSIVIVDLLGIEKLTNAFGFIALFQGLVALAGLPISGKFHVNITSVHSSFNVDINNLKLYSAV